MADKTLFTELSVRIALQAFHDIQRLGMLDLAQARFVTRRLRLLCSNTATEQLERGITLQTALREAVELLKPTSPIDLNDSDWRRYTALYKQYICKLRPTDVARLMALQESAYHDERRHAVIRLLTVLLRWERAAQATTDDLVIPPDSRLSTEPILLAPKHLPIKMIGRDGLLATVTSELLRGSDVALCGLPGAGKSTFAIAIANAPQIAVHFVDGVLWAALGPSGDVLSTLRTWLHAFEPSQPEINRVNSLQAFRQAVTHKIGMRRMLIVVDDIWSGDAIETLRVGGPNCTYLFTTRIPRLIDELSGYSTYTLPELDESDSLQVLTHLAPLVAKYHETQLTELAQAVGGLPLALNVMGHHLRVAEHGSQRRLKDALKALQLPRVRLELHDPQKTQQGGTVRETIALSERSLTESARNAFHRLGVFPPAPSTFSEAAALAVAECTTDDLDALVDNGLLEIVDGRYELHPVIQDYAVEKVSDGAIYMRMLAFYVDSVRSNHLDIFRIATENANINTALELVEQRASLGINAANSEDIPAGLDVFIQATIMFFPALESQGRYGAAEQYLLTALAASQYVNDKSSIATIHLRLGQLTVKQSNLNQAQKHFESSLLAIQQMDHLPTAIDVTQQVGDVAFERGNYQVARQCYDDGLLLAQKQCNDDLLCSLYLRQGAMAERLGDYVSAERWLQQGMESVRILKSSRRMCEALSQSGVLKAKRGQMLGGLFDLVRALHIARRIHHSEIICALLASLAIGAMSVRRFQLADRWSAETLLIARRLGHSRLITFAITTRGNFESMNGRFAAAEEHYQDALTQAEHNENGFDLCFVRNCMGVHFCLKHDWSQAIDNLTRSIEISARMQLRELNGYAKFYQAQALYARGEQVQAIALAQDSLNTFVDMGYGLAREVQHWLANARRESHLSS